MENISFGSLFNKAGEANYTKPNDLDNVIKYIVRENGDSPDDLIALGGLGVTEFLGTDTIIKQFHAVQKMHTRKGNFGRYIDHEVFSFLPETERLIYDNNLDVDTIARKMAYDFYEKDHCQVVYGIHRPPDKNKKLHIHFAVNTVSYVTCNKRRENKRQTKERNSRFNKIVADAVRKQC